MKKINTSIEIVSSTRFGFSSMSCPSRESALRELSRHFADVRITIANEVEDLEALVERRPDLVFLGTSTIKPTTSNEIIWLSEYLDAHDIAYSGSDKIAHRYEKNKPLAKDRVASLGLATSASFVAGSHNMSRLSEHELHYPLFVKPVNRGGGTGIDENSYVENHAQLRAKVSSITQKHRADSLVEEYLPGREFSVAIIRDESSQQYMAMPIELVAEADSKGVSMLSESVKESNLESAHEVTDDVLAAKVTNLALEVFKALGARDYGRIDIRLDQDGQPNFLEANLLPSLIEGYGSFPKACLINRGMSYSHVLQLIVQLGLQRSTAFNTLSIWPKTTEQLPIKL